jgi:hypothetical protein
MDALNRHLRVNGCGGGISSTAYWQLEPS